VTHDHNDATIGAYLAGELPTAPREAFEHHLLTRDACWADVDASRRGRTLVEHAREPAPDHLRDQVTAAVAKRSGRRNSRIPVLATIAAALVVALAAAVGVWSTRPAAQPAPISLAVAGYRADRLPGPGIPDQAGPDLTGLHLVEAGAGTGQLGGQPVTGYAFRDQTGRRILIYRSQQPFPMPAGSAHPTGPDGAAAATYHGVTVLCSRHPHTLLVLGDDPRLVWWVATALNLT
jgi:hypothetical protein